MIQILEADGWIWERTRGSHRVDTHSAKPGIVVVRVSSVGMCAWAPSGASASRRGEVSGMIGYAVIVEQADDGGYGAWSPDLPGCVALGDTVEECLADMTAAVILYVDVLRERGHEVPEPRAIEAVTVPAA